MSVISFRESVAAGATETIRVQLSRPFIRAVTLSLYSSAALANQVGVRMESQGQTILPIPQSGADANIYLENHVPLLIEPNKEVNGPPYEIAITFVNENAAAIVVVSGWFEVYNTPYPQVRVKLPGGKDAEANPYVTIFEQLQGTTPEET